MENNKEIIIDWAIRTFGSDLQLKEQRWNVFSSQPYFDYIAEISIEGRTFVGRGVSASQMQALHSAIAEAIERYGICLNCLNNSNGIAIHTSERVSTENAMMELIERHYCMLFTLGYMQTGSKIASGLLPEKLKRTLSLFQELKINFDFYIVGSEDFFYSTICQASGLDCDRKFGVFTGAACKNSLAVSLEKSFLEAITNVVAFLNDNLCPLQYSEFLKFPNPEPMEHLQLYSDYSFGKKYLEERKFLEIQNKIINKNIFHFERLNHAYDDYLSIFQASCSSLIPPAWGKLPEMVFGYRNINPLFPLVLG